jgi:RimK family alpha-L-glutamate ligase
MLNGGKKSKNKQVLVLFPFKKDRRLDFAGFVKSVNKYAENDNLAVQGSLKNLIFEIKDSKLKITEAISGRDLRDFKAIYVRRLKSKTQEKVTAVAIAADAWGIKVVNSENTNLQSFSKLTELVALSLKGLPIPDTIIAAKSEVKSILKEGKFWLPFPLIMKDANGSIGSRNYLIKNKKGLKEILNLPENKDRIFVYQQMVPNDGDYRFLITGDKVGVVIHRSAVEGDHRNNTSLGAKAELIPLNKFSLKLKKDAVNAAKALHRELCGVDVLVDKDTDKHYILEVNKKTMLDEGTYVPEKMKAVSKFFEEL